MVEIQRHALVPYSAEQMYMLVNDVANYADFLPGVSNTEVFEQSETEMRASMTLKRAGVSAEFITCNRLVPAKSIEMNLESGPFKSLTGVWRFHDFDGLGCKVELDLRFEPESRALGSVISALMSHVGGQLVSDFSKQADVRYG